MDHHLAVIIHHRRAVIAVVEAAGRDVRPSARACGVEVAGHLLRPGVEDLAVGREIHEGIVVRPGGEDAVLRGGGSEIAPGAAGDLPDLRGLVHVDRDVHRAGLHQEIAIAQDGCRGIPAARIHVRDARPDV